MTWRPFVRPLALLMPGALLAVIYCLTLPDRATRLRHLDLPALQREARAHPNDPEVFFALGSRLRRQGDRERAGVMVRRAYDVSRGDARATAALIGALIDAGQWAEAEQRASEARARWPEAGTVRAQLSRFLNERGRFAEALGEARDAVRLAPELAPAWQALGNALARNGQGNAAEAAFQRALRWEPNDMELLADVGEARVKFGRAAEAEVVLARAITMAPRAARPVGLLGQLKAARARTPSERDAARELLEQATARAPGAAHPRYHLGLLAARDGRPEDAVRWLNECLERDPGYGEAYLALGQVYRDAGRVAESNRAFAAWQRFSEDRREVAHLALRLRRAPEDVTLLRRLADRHTDAGRAAQAAVIEERIRALRQKVKATRAPKE